MIPRRKLFVFGYIALAVVAFDFLKFVLIGGSTVIDWPSVVHPAWVLAAIALFLVGAWFSRPAYWSALFWLYLAIFTFAFVNQYFDFTTVITSGCIIFNFGLTGMYYLLSSQAAYG